MSKVKVIFNNFSAVQKAVVGRMDPAVEGAADELEKVLERALDDGYKNVESDTRALALSLYVKATGRDDYDQALSAARDAYLGNPSRYRSSPATDKARANFEAMVADMEQLDEREQNIHIAAVVTMLAYGNVWEFERGWMLAPALEWAMNRCGAVIAAEVLKAIQSVT
jgi:hypothetical protein